MVDDEGEEKKVEEHIEAVEPEVIAKFGLVSTPGTKDFKQEKKEGDRNEPIKVIVPTRVANFFD